MSDQQIYVHLVLAFITLVFVQSYPAIPKVYVLSTMKNVCNHLYLNMEDPASFLQSVDLNNRAVALTRQGRYHEAIPLHRQAIEKKERIHGPVSIQAAISYNGLGK